MKRTPRQSAAQRLALAIPLMMTGLACGDDSGSNPPNTTPAALAIVSGNNQSGTVGRALGGALVVRVTNSQGAALSGVGVAWTVVSGGGVIASSSSSTNGQGEASTTYTVGSTPGVNQVSAAVADMRDISTTFTATGTPAPPPPTGGQPVDVSVDDNFYAASNVTINAGESVKWTWTGQAAHTVTLDPPRSDESGIQSSGTFTVQFNNPGTFTYFCRVHGRAIMSGQVVVN